jgi:isoamylase
MMMDAAEVVARYAAGERDFRGVSLHQAALAWANLSGADFAEADLREADLSQADLRHTNFRRANLRGVNLQGANLQGANLLGADLQDAALQQANLAMARLAGRNHWAAVEGSSMPLGISWIAAEQSYNFALYARHATGVSILLYAAQDLVQPIARVRLDHLMQKSGRVWHCRLSATEVSRATYYAYAVEGPFNPAQGHRFDPEKVLLDPYAQTIFFPPGFDRNASKGRGSNASKTPLGEIPAPRAPFDWGQDPRPRHTSDTVIYEMHVKELTMRANSEVSADTRGTYAGVIDKIPYLQDLGVTVVELLPVYQYDPEDGGNYWGYMPLNFFAPHHAYAMTKMSAERADEFRTMVKALHEAGIEVVLDVVYNHTSEQDENGPTYSYRAIDNSTYYLLDMASGQYRNDAGTGNVFRTAHPAARKMIIDSLRFWVKEMHVDGFRFDLASIFTRNQDGSINLEDPSIISEISADPDFADIRLIAEPWDLATYQLGRSFPGHTWLQWNGQFRDAVRSFVKGDSGYVGALMACLYGSDYLFPDHVDAPYHPYQSVNFITSHDGFCLYDLVSYNIKRNEANGQNNRDGTDDNRSWNCGWESDLNVPAEVMQLRKRQIKNFCCLVFIANGTPMFCTGDEFMNTQKGNNNPYNQDNETTWLDWDLLPQNHEIFRFFKTMIAFRKAHPSLSRSRFWREDVRWYGVGNAVDMSYDSHSLAVCVHGASQQDQDIYVMINAYWQDLTFMIQEGQASEWRRVVDTSLPSPSDFSEPGSEVVLQSLSYQVRARSVVVLVRQ